MTIRASRPGSIRTPSVGVADPGHAGPVDAGGVPAGGGEQRQPVLGAAGRGEQVGAGDDGADEGVLLQREEVEAAVRRGRPAG